MLPRVSLAAPHQMLPALRLLFPSGTDLPPDARDSLGVFVAADAVGQIRAAMMVQSLAGAIGLAWPPFAEPDVFGDALVAASCEWLRNRGVKVCQAFATANEANQFIPLERNGFHHVTSLLSLRREIAGELPITALTFEPHLPPFTDEFRTVLLATHQETHDCPELYRNRTDEDLIAGFDEPLDSTCWHLARLAGEPIGVLMLTAGAQDGEAELAYLGVLPRFRGRGLGRELVAFARTVASHRPATALTVSVDRRNAAALKVYAHHDFTQTSRREVWLAHFSQ
jgi:mycothiol synthase